MALGRKRWDRAARARSQKSGSFARPLWIEQLEDRRMLATFTVNNLGDLQLNNDNELEVVPNSLRAAIIAANENEEADIIFFSENLANSLITPGNVIQLRTSGDDFGQLTIEDSVTIIGLGARKLTIEAAPGRRVFEIDPMGMDPFSVSIEGLTISGGTAVGMDADGQGGAILNGQNLTLTEVVIQNSVANEGGGIYNTGNLTVIRSLIVDNTAFSNGGGIQNGADSMTGGATTGPPPVTTIIASTISGNTANTGSGYGGGLFNRDGRLNVNNSTIVGNKAYLGSGIGSFGNALPAEEGGDPPPATIFTTVSGSILFNNQDFMEGEPVKIDIDVVGKGEEDDMGMAPPLNPSINIDGSGMPSPMVGGFNAIFGLGAQVVASMGDLPPMTNPRFLGIEDPITGEITPILANFGGSTDTFHPDPDISPVINKINDGSGFDQRGRHFTRVFEAGAMMPRQDIGAVEVQNGTFVVDVFDDEFNDGQFSSNQGVTTIGDFSIREALDFSRLNPLVDTITFNVVRDGQIDPTPSPAPTILLNLGTLNVDHSVNIVGPESFVLEIDGKDPSTVFADGTRIFNITDQDDTNAVDVSISQLTLVGGDVGGSGGAILNRENLTVSRTSIQSNRASLDGSAIHHDRGMLNVISTTISGNTSSDDGAIYIAQNSGATRISNTTISGNSAGDRGAGVFNRGTNTRIEFTTITNNTSGSTIGSGVMNFAGKFASGGSEGTPAVAATLTFYSTIISGNFLNDVAAMSSTGGDPASLVVPITRSDGYNLVGTPNAAASNVFSSMMHDIFSTSPGLAPLAFAGGLTKTHTLLMGSPAIDKGDIAPVNAPEFDQRGNPFERIFDGTEDAVEVLRIDIGAYELQGRVFRVDNLGDVSDGNFTALNLTLREAIELANFGPLKDIIEFDTSAPGFENTPTISPNSALAITDDVLIRWQGATPLTLGGTGTAFAINDGNSGTFIDVEIRGAERGVGEFILSGRSIVNSENLTIDVVDILGNSTSAITHQLGKLEILNSTLTGNISNVSGGAVNAENASKVSVHDSTFTGNSTAFTNGHGGAIYLKNSPFEGNMLVLASNLTAAGAADGAGLYVDNSGIPVLLPNGKLNPANDVRFVNSVISGNSTIGANSDGAGIFAKNADVFLSNYTTVALNTTFGTNSKGGAVYLDGGGSLTISDNVTFSFNKTLGQFSSGGAIASVGGRVNIFETNISNNSTSGADAHGGAIYILDGSLLLEKTSIFDNRTTGLRSDGGGIYSNTNLIDNRTTILNSTISGNTTLDRGGGIYNVDGLTSILQSTITNNSAPYYGSGAGVGSFGDSATTRTNVRSSIIAGNKVSAIPDPMNPPDASNIDRINGNFDDTIHSLSYNLIGTSITDAFTASGDQFGIDAPEDVGLEPLAATNGGPTQTHKLMDTSLAINAGDPTADILDDFSVNAFASKYNYFDILDSNNAPQVTGGVANLNVGTGTGAFIWKQGHRLKDVGDIVSVEVSVSASAPHDSSSTAGLALVSTVNGGAILAQIQVNNNKDTEGTSTYELTDGLNTIAIVGSPTGPMNLRLLVVAAEDGKLTIETLLSGPGINEIPTTRSINATQAFFGLSASNVSDTNSSHDNLSITTQFDQRGETFVRVRQGRIDIGAYESDFTPVLAGDFDGDGVVSGRDFLVWQRGNSPNPLSSTDLSDWQANFGSSSPIVAALQVEEQEPEPTFVSAAIRSEQIALTPVAPTIADDSQSDFTLSRSIQLGLGVPALFVSKNDKVAPAASEPEVVDAALSDVVYSSDSATYGSDSESDFGDIAVSRSGDADSEELAAADEVFDLIGSGAF